MIPAAVKPQIFSGPHIEGVQSGPVITWSQEDFGGFSVCLYDDGTALILSRREGQPTRAYDLRADDVATLASFLRSGMTPEDQIDAPCADMRKAASR